MTPHAISETKIILGFETIVPTFLHVTVSEVLNHGTHTRAHTHEHTNTPPAYYHHATPGN